MNYRELQIGICGTFDVENYGDLLFPLIAEAELSHRLDSIKLHRFSYLSKSHTDWPYSVNSLSDLPAAAHNLDGLIIGGGHLIRFDKQVAPGYEPPTPTIHHPTGYWLTPALIALQNGLPVVWNAPGVHGRIPDWAEPLMRLAIKLSSYVSVRDEASQQALAPFDEESKTAVVPDTAFGVAKLIDANHPSRAFNRLRETLGLKSRYIVVQAIDGLKAFSRLVAKHTKLFKDYQLVVLPIGPILGDDNEIFGRNVHGVVRLPVWPDPLLLAELIANAEAAVGVSLHLSITALSSGVPVFRPLKNFDGKYKVLSNFDTVAPFDSHAEIDPAWFVARMGRTEPSKAVNNVFSQLSDHWDNVAAAFINAERNASTLEAIGHFWESLPNLLESWSVHHAAVVNARNAAIAERDQQIAELNTVLDTKSNKSEDSYGRTESINNSTFHRIISPLRSLGRKLRWQKPVKD